MLQFFLNPMMLAGLMGISLPVIAHLLSRRKYDVVHWGAMQFLNPSRKTRRKMKLEELLLLLIRMAIIALLAIAAARPWINSGFLTGYRSAGSRDIVLVIDGSNSMSRSDGLTSLHQKAIRRASEFLATLQPGDTVAVIDARDRPVRVVDSPLQDVQLVRDTLQAIPPPAGAADLHRACEEAIGILGRCSNGSREIVVLTDRQRCGWAVGSETAWSRFDDVLNFPSVKPRMWVADMSAGLGAIQQNISLGEVEISRDLTVPGFPVSFQVAVQNAGQTAVNVPVQVLVDGQRMKGMDATVAVPPNSETIFSRSVRFDTLGTNILSVRAVVQDDALSADDESHAALQVTSAIPVLLVESSQTADETKWKTFFARMALTNPQNRTPWILARTVKRQDFTPDDLSDVAVVVLADVTRLPGNMTEALHSFAAEGHGVFITSGTDSSPESFEQLFAKSGLLPTVRLKRMRHADPDAATPTTIAPYSLEAGWLKRFRERKGASLLTAPFRRWWIVETTAAPASPHQQDSDANPAEQPQAAAPQKTHSEPPVTIAQLTTGDPLLVQALCGRGSVLLMTSSLDTSMNSLATTPDYVPFLHEALFQMAASTTRRNVDFGQPLMTTITKPEAAEGVAVAAEPDSLIFQTPHKTEESAEVRERATDWVATLPTTRFPGIYQLVQTEEDASSPVDAFVVNYNHEEDNPAELTPDDRARLIVNDRMTFVESFDSLKKLMYGDESRSELWAWLLAIFLVLLTLEVWMTRRLVVKGHADTNLQAPVAA